MFDVEHIEAWQGQQIVDPEGNKIGKLEEIYTDLDSGKPGVGCVKTGMFGRRLSLVPLEGASLSRDYVRIPYSKEQVKEAPRAEPGGQLTREEEVELFRHYGLQPPPGKKGGPGHARYESPVAELERQAAVQAALQQAEALEAEAQRKDKESEKAFAAGHEADQHARRAQAERDEALRAAQAQRDAAERARGS